jgi:hypothetical protein
LRSLGKEWIFQWLANPNWIRGQEIEYPTGKTLNWKTSAYILETGVSLTH